MRYRHFNLSFSLLFYCFFFVSIEIFIVWLSEYKIIDIVAGFYILVYFIYFHVILPSKNYSCTKYNFYIFFNTFLSVFFVYHFNLYDSTIDIFAGFYFLVYFIYFHVIRPLIKDSIIRHSPRYSWNIADGELSKHKSINFQVTYIYGQNQNYILWMDNKWLQKVD